MEDVPSMQGIQGDLQTMSVTDLLLFLLEKKLKGTIRCAQGPREKSVVVVDGHAVMASSNDAREYLGQFLINFGHLTEEQLDDAFETQRQTKVYLGRILTMIDLVTEPELETVLQLKIRETVLSLTEWTHGTFHFDRDVLPDLGPGVQVSVPVNNIRDEAEFRRTAWTSMRQVFPRGSDFLEIDRSKLAPDHNNPLDNRILELAEQGESIDGIGLHLHATDFALYQRLFSLSRLGVLEPREALEGDEPLDVEVVELDSIPEVMGEAANLDTLIEQVRTFLEKGLFQEAEQLARTVAALDPANAELQALVKETETGLLAELRESLLRATVTPKMIKNPDTVEGLRLSAAERYLLKRFDGTRSLRQVIRVSPIRELDALKLIRRFVDSGVVTLN